MAFVKLNAIQANKRQRYKTFDGCLATISLTKTIYSGFFKNCFAVSANKTLQLILNPSYLTAHAVANVFAFQLVYRTLLTSSC